MKKIQILIITLVSILTLAGVIFTVLYFATDTFKSDKDMFYKYISQTNISELIEVDSQDNYQERLKNESHTNIGTISLKVKENETSIIDESFNYSSQVDPVNKLASSTVGINKNGEKILTVNYLRNEDLYGLKFEEIVNQYMIFENSNLKEFATKFGIQDTSNIPDKIDIYQMMEDAGVEQINLEEFKPVYDKYLDLIIENIPEECYSKVEEGYELTINLETLQEILLEVLNTLKDDEETFDIINSLVSKVNPSISLVFEDYQTALQQLIDEISVVEIEENYEILNITAYKEGKIYIKVGIDEEEKTYLEAAMEKSENEIILSTNIVEKSLYTNSETNITFNKRIDAIENDQYCINVISKEDESETLNINIVVSRNGKLDSNNIKNAILATIIIPSENVEMSLEYNNDKTFTSNLEIERINADNHLIINNLDKDQIQNLTTNLGNLISEKTNLNPVEILGATGVGFISTVPVGTQETAVIGGVLVGTSVTVTLNAGLFETAQQATQEAQINMDNQMVQTFNSQFTVYEGTRKGTEVRGLWNVVSASNAVDFNHIVTLIGVAQEEVEASKTYNVSTRKDAEGYVNQVIIEENNQYSTELQDAIETESALSNGMIETNGQMYNVDEYVYGL